MRSRHCGILLVLCVGCDPTPQPDAAFAADLTSRASQDQAQMEALAAHWTDSAYHQQLARTLVANARWLDSAVGIRGWPDRAAVGDSGADAAFLIAQHADSLPAAQRRLLEALRVAVAAGTAKPVHLAYLEDRVRKASGHPQLYGTQVGYDAAGEAQVPEVDDPASLDRRRRAVGLPPMGEYLDTLRAVNRRMRAAQPAEP